MIVKSPIEQWFARRGWKPFGFQRQTWRAYLAGESGLVHAPTGVGKTLAVWLGPLAEYLAERPRCTKEPVAARSPATNPANASRAGRSSRSAERLKAEPLRVLWLTPLRALANDTLAALREPVAELGLPWIVEGRTGDTSGSLKLRQRERLPTALITTPESLSILLSYADARQHFATLRCVVVDEWHELMSTKRGVQTELALARLRTWRPDVRVWGLSATLGNLDQARDVLLAASTSASHARATRPPRLIESRLSKEIQVRTLIPDDLTRFPWSGHLGTRMAAPVAAALETARTTLLFTNTRWQAEMWFRALNLHRPDWLGQIALHHGSLDRGLRTQVEQRLKEGRLRAVVCTSSLDLGVDFPPVDQVIQIGSPKGIARLLQRAGRAGHQPGQLSRVLCVPAHAFELIEFAAARDGIATRSVEARPPLERPLDVLAQHVVTIALGEGFDEQELFDEVRRTHAFRDLTREQWRWVLDFVQRGGPSLTAYPQYARVKHENGRYVIASPRIGSLHRMNIGTIAGETAMIVKLGTRTLGTIEESFVSRLTSGDVFTFAGRVLELQRIRGNEVWVRRATVRSGVIPRWNGGRFSLSTQLAERVRARVARGAASASENENLAKAEPEILAAQPLLELQARWSLVPQADELLIERVDTTDGGHWFVYPFEGRSVHEGLAALIALRLTRREPLTLNLTANDYGFEVLGPPDLQLDVQQWRDAMTPDDLLPDLLACVNSTQMVRRQFRDIARVAGLILSNYPGAAKPSRQLQASSDMFFDVLSEFDPGSLLLDQARREVLSHQLEVRRLEQALQSIAARRVVIVRPAQPTPLGFPLMAERMRTQHVSSEKWSQRVERLALRLERAADRPARVAAGLRPGRSRAVRP